MNQISLITFLLLGIFFVLCSSEQKSALFLANSRFLAPTQPPVSSINEASLVGSHDLKTEHKHSISPFTLAINIIADLCPHGMLPLAYGFAQGGPSGIIPALLLITLFGSMSAYTMTAFAKLGYETGSSTISEIWAKLISPKTAWIVDASIFALCYGCCVFYSAFIGDIFGALAVTLNLKGIFAIRSNILLAISLFILLPLCLQDDLSSLQFSSFLGAFGVIFTTAFHVIRLLDHSYVPGSPMLEHIASRLRPSFPASGAFNLWNTNFGTLMLANLFCVAFLAHYNSINYFQELNSTLQTYQKTVAIGFGISTIVFATMMLVGYRLFGQSALPLILNNFPNKQDELAILARLATGVAITFAYPLMFAGLKSALISLIDRFRRISEPTRNGAVKNTSDPNKVLKTSLLLVSLGTIAAIASKCGEEDVSVVLGLVGSITGCFVAYILPGLLNLTHMRARNRVGLSNNRIEGIVNHILIILGVVFGIFGVYVTLLPSEHQHHI